MSYLSGKGALREYMKAGGRFEDLGAEELSSLLWAESKLLRKEGEIADAYLCLWEIEKLGTARPDGFWLEFASLALDSGNEGKAAGLALDVWLSDELSDEAKNAAEAIFLKAKNEGLDPVVFKFPVEVSVEDRQRLYLLSLSFNVDQKLYLRSEYDYDGLLSEEGDLYPTIAVLFEDEEKVSKLRLQVGELLVRSQRYYEARQWLAHFVEDYGEGSIRSASADALLLECQAVPELKDGKDWELQGMSARLLWVPPGSFRMGSERSERGRADDELAHSVSLGGFWLGETEVTVAQFQEYLNNMPWEDSEIPITNDGFPLFRGSGGVIEMRRYHDPSEDPIPMINRVSAGRFCAWLTQRDLASGVLPDGYAYALPSEAQWEYACRAGTDTAFSFGDKFVKGIYNVENSKTNKAKRNRAVFRKRYIGEGTVGVYRFEPNTWGFYGMHGNLREWCADQYGSYDELDTNFNPINLANAEESSFVGVTRGGSWMDRVEDSRSAKRHEAELRESSPAVGFRIALIKIREHR